MSNPRVLTAEELANLIRLVRDGRQWSQETLATLSGLSVRTIQRVERGEKSDIDTRRALARAFGVEDIDAFNKPHSLPTLEEVKQAAEKFERENRLLDTKTVTSGRELATLYAQATMDCASPAFELDDDAAADFAAMVDYLRDYRDSADLYGETDKLEIFDELQRYIEGLDARGVSLAVTRRQTKLVGENWADKTPWPVSLIYLTAFPKGKVPAQIAMPRKVQIGG